MQKTIPKAKVNIITNLRKSNYSVYIVFITFAMGGVRVACDVAFLKHYSDVKIGSKEQYNITPI